MDSNSAQGTLNNANQQQQSSSAGGDFGFTDSSTVGAGNALPMDGIGQGADQRVQTQQQQSQPQFDIEKMISEVIGGDQSQAQDQQQQQSSQAQQGADSELTRFDQHPRWIAREEELKQLRSDLDVMRGQLMGRQQADPTDTNIQQQQVPYKDVTTMSNEDIEQWFNNDKVGFMANFYAQVAHETENNIMQRLGQQQQQKSVAQTYEQFADKHPDIKQMWAGGQIQQFMNQHPGHTPISAYYEIKGASDTGSAITQAQMEEAIAKAKKDAEQEVAAKLRAKFQALGTLGAAPAGSNAGNQTITDLRTNPKGNNLTSALAAKLDAMRASGQQ